MATSISIETLMNSNNINKFSIKSTPEVVCQSIDKIPEIEYINETLKVNPKNIQNILKKHNLLWAMKQLPKSSQNDILFLSFKKENSKKTLCESKYYNESGKCFIINPKDKTVIKKTLERTTKRISDYIQKSLYHSLIPYNLSKDIFNDCLQALGFSINLKSDLKKGDRFEILYSAIELPNGTFHYPQLEYISIKLKNKTHHIYVYKQNGVRNFYDENGKVLNNKNILQFPIKGYVPKVSSNFGMRFHPVHKVYRFHRGIDYKGPKGANIFPASKGKVTKASYIGGYGNLVEVKHSDNNTITRYAHLQKIKVKKGDEVTKNTVVGKLGDSGTTTRHHLHYEVIKNGRHINPKTISYIEESALKKGDLEKFKKLKSHVDFQVAKLDAEKNYVSVA